MREIQRVLSHIAGEIKTKLDDRREARELAQGRHMEERRVVEIENLSRYPQFSHAENCIRTSGITIKVLSYGMGEFGMDATAYYIGTCNDLAHAMIVS